MKNPRSIILVSVFVAAAVFIIIFETADFPICDDAAADKLYSDIISRAVIAAAVVALTLLAGYGKLLAPRRKGILRALLWCIPCLAVALANFPYSALASGEAQILRADLLWAVVLKCLLIGVTEELIFRGILLILVSDLLGNGNNRVFLTIVISSAIFALYHLLNLFAGAGLGVTLLQVGYSFLTGAMFAAVMTRTRNIWLCIALHTVYDIGGLIVSDIGSGAVHDLIFWVLTAVAAVICCVHVILYLIRKPEPFKL